MGSCNAQRRARRQLGRAHRRVDAMGPHDLLGCGHACRGRLIGPVDHGLPRDGLTELASAHGEDATTLADLVLLGRQRNRLVRRAARVIDQLSGRDFEPKLVTILRIGHRLRILHDVEPQVERVAPKDVSHVVAAHDDQLEPNLFGHAFQAGGTHLARRPDRESVAGDQEGLAIVHPGSKVRHQVTERARLPSLIECLETLGDAISGRSNLVRVDRGELRTRFGIFPPIPEHQRPPAHPPRLDVRPRSRV